MNNKAVREMIENSSNFFIFLNRKYMAGDMNIQLLEIAVEKVKADSNKKLTVENVIAIYRQLVYNIYMPTGI